MHPTKRVLPVNVEPPVFHRFTETRYDQHVHFGERVLDARVLLHYPKLFRRFDADILGPVHFPRVNGDFRNVLARFEFAHVDGHQVSGHRRSALEVNRFRVVRPAMEILCYRNYSVLVRAPMRPQWLNLKFKIYIYLSLDDFITGNIKTIYKEYGAPPRTQLITLM